MGIALDIMHHVHMPGKKGKLDSVLAVYLSGSNKMELFSYGTAQL